MNTSSHPLCRAATRLAASFVLFALPLLLFLHDAKSGVGVAEGGYVETAQLVAILLSGLVFAAAARRASCRGGRLAPALLFVALGCGCMAVRELDGFFDAAVAHGAWKVFAIPFALGAVALAVRRRAALLDSIAALLESRAGILLEVFLLALLVFSRGFGTKVLWNTLFSSMPDRLPLDAEMAGHVARTAKNAVEEVTELFAYAQLLLAACVAYVAAAARTGDGRGEESAR